LWFSKIALFWAWFSGRNPILRHGSQVTKRGFTYCFGYSRTDVPQRVSLDINECCYITGGDNDDGFRGSQHEGIVASEY
jgi:hypothetical protein